MLSTAFVTYTQEQIDTMYNINRNEVDGYSYLYADHPLSCHHIEGAVHFMNQCDIDVNSISKSDLQIIILNLPQNKDTVLARRIIRRGDFMSWTNVFDLYHWTYSKQIASRILQVSEDQVLELDCNILMSQSVVDIFANITHCSPKNEQCQLMHQRWLDMIRR